MRQPVLPSPKASQVLKIANPTRVGSSNVESIDKDSPNEYLPGVWGQLPERFWQRLQSAGIDRFLPKYEKLIEEYYKTLAESENNVQ